MSDYIELETASPEELLESAVWFYTQHASRPSDVERFLRLGFALAQVGGWQQIAPAWLQQSKTALRFAAMEEEARYKARAAAHRALGTSAATGGE